MVTGVMFYCWDTCSDSDVFIATFMCCITKSIICLFIFFFLNLYNFVSDTKTNILLTCIGSLKY